MIAVMPDPIDKRLPVDVRGQRVLVTGGAGVIARELLDRLSERGARVLSIDRLPLDRPAPPGVDHLVADLAQTDLGPIAEFAPVTIMHLAATFERSVESAEFWEQNWTDNVVVTHRLADLAARIGGVEAFVFASSYLIYRSDQYTFPEPSRDGVALLEESAVLPRNLCGAAKLYGEAEVTFARDVLGGGFRTASARIFRVYGRGSRDVVSRWVRAALRGEPIEVYHPENRFDYVYAGDVAEGLLRIATHGRAEGVLNLGTGRARSVSDVIAAIEAATGRPLRMRTVAVDERYEASCAELTRLHDRLGWIPGTDLETGVARLVAHERAAMAPAHELADAPR
jgi:carbamoyl-phosphate synthase large subunit